MTIAAAIKLLTCIESILLGVLVLKQDSRSLRSRLFALYLFAVGAQALVEYHLVASDALASFLFWKHFDVFVYPGIGVMFHFAAVYADARFVRRRAAVVLNHALFLGTALLVALAAFPISARPSPSGFDYVRSPLGQWVFDTTLAMSVAVCMAALYLFWRKYRRAEGQGARRQARIMFVAMGSLIVSGVVFELMEPVLQVPTPWAFSATTAFFLVNPFLGYAMLRYDMLEMTPATAAEDVLQMMSDGVLLLDPKGRIQYANPAAGNLFGRKPGQLRGRRVADLPLRVALEAESGWRPTASRSRESILDEEGLLDVPGRGVVPVSVATSPMQRKQDLVGYIVTIRDISVRKQAADRRNAVEKIMRHDLKNALTAVMGYSEMLQMAPGLDETHLRWAKTIFRAGETMQRLIESYLAVECIETGTYRLRTAKVNLVAVVDEVVTSLATLALDRGVRVGVRVDGAPFRGETLSVRSHETLLFSMLANLTKNAIEASAPGGEVTIAMVSGEDISIRIANPGSVPEALRACFFDKYVTHGKANGTGLGTYSARLISETLGGGVALDVDDEEGTVAVIVTLPSHPVDRAEPGAPCPSAPEDQAANG